MTIKELIDANIFTLLNDGGNHDTVLTGCYCCDLLSIAMGHAPEGCVWVTVMNNVNTLAVASLAECGCVVLSCGVVADDAFLAKAKEQNITVFKTDLPVFDAALKAHEIL